MKRQTANGFSEVEVEAMEGLVRVVAFVCGITVEEIKSKSRKREITDARKMVCMYANDNIPHRKYQVQKNLKLATWYFECDHSTISHAIDCGRDLYKNDSAFQKAYDSVIDFINDPKYSPDFTYNELYAMKKTWEDVRMNHNESHSVRYSLMPQYIKQDIINLFNKGYGEYTISQKVGTIMEFIVYFCDKEGLKRDKFDKIKQAMLEVKLQYKKEMQPEY